MRNFIIGGLSLLGAFTLTSRLAAVTEQRQTVDCREVLKAETEAQLKAGLIQGGIFNYSGGIEVRFIDPVSGTIHIIAFISSELGLGDEVGPTKRVGQCTVPEVRAPVDVYKGTVTPPGQKA